MFTRDALMLIGHGSTTLPEATRPLLDHAAAIRDTGRFAEVAVGVLLGQPDAAEAFDNLTAAVVYVVPFFLEDGYFTRIAIPDLLLPRAASAQVIRLCPPAGSHPGIALLLETRLRRHCELHGTNPKSLSVLLVGHGSAKNPGRARALRQHASRLEAGGHFGWVRIAHLEEPPYVAETLASTRGHVVAVIGYFASEGVHATQDLPALIAEERVQRGTTWPPVHDLGSIGADPAMRQLILDQVTATR